MAHKQPFSSHSFPPGHSSLFGLLPKPLIILSISSFLMPFALLSALKKDTRSAGAGTCGYYTIQRIDAINERLDRYVNRAFGGEVRVGGFGDGE